jgi:acetylornithine/succinyldiaminopimelate/putrescine aminotransferase
MHAATYGGNPIAARAGIAAIEIIENEDLLENVGRLSEVFHARLDEARKKNAAIRDLRILGLMIGIELSVPGAPVVEACLKRKLLVNCTQGNVLRLLPAMNLTPEQVEEGCDILAQALGEAT